MMTNWYLIRATEVRDRAIAAAEHQDALYHLQPDRRLKTWLAMHLNAIRSRLDRLHTECRAMTQNQKPKTQHLC
jgi:hypothetical protein